MNEESKSVDTREQEILKKTFTGNEALLKSIRALFFGLDVSEEEKLKIKDTFSNPELLQIFWDRFCPELDKDAPIGQVSDVWLGAESMVFGQSESTIEQAVMYKDESIRLVKRALALLTDPDREIFDLTYAPDVQIADPLRISLLARNQYIRHIEKQLLFIWLIAEQGTLSDSELKTRLEKNSSK